MPVGDYLAADRAAALARSRTLPDAVSGAMLVADISGFTPLTVRFARALGPHLGAEEVARHINDVYEALIGTVQRHAGVVVSFAGDAVTCWFAAPARASAAASAPRRAVRCGSALQKAMAALGTIATPGGDELRLALKVAVAAGPIRRFLVGDPAIQRFDVLAGATVVRLAAAEQLAGPGEVVVDQAVAEQLPDGITIGAWRCDTHGARCCAAITPHELAAALPQHTSARRHAARNISVNDARQLLLPALAERFARGYGEPPIELRPVVALCLRFATLDYDHDPAAGSQLDAYIRWVQAVAAHYGGALIQVSIAKGSFCYLTFGAPVAHENDAQRALWAALDLQAPPSALAFAGAAQIGLARGIMRAGSYGGSGRRTYGVLGDAVNTAARLMEAAPAGQILVDAALQQAGVDLFSWQPLPPLRVKGKREPVMIARLLAAQQDRTTAFYQGAIVGRDVELAQLLAAAQPVLDGHFAGVCAVLGEAGVGKSRLVYEARQRLAAWTALTWMYCPSDGVLRGSLQPFAAGLRTYFRQASACDAAENTARFDAVLDALVGALQDQRQPEARGARARTLATELGRRRSVLGALLGLHWDGSPYEQLAPTSRFAATLAAVTTLLQAESLRRPVWLELEDAHWLDDDSRTLLAHLSRALTGFPVVVVCATRPDDDGRPVGLDVADNIPLSTIALEPLAPESIHAFAAQVVGGEVADGLTQFVYDRTGGNPLFAEQLLLDLRERGRLQHTPDTGGQSAGELVWSMNIDRSAMVDVPETLRSLLVARLDRLAEPVRRLVQAAAVLGRAWELPVLAAMHLDDAKLLAGVHAAERDQIWSPLSGRAYLFRHVLLRDAAYQMQARAQLRGLHQRAAAAIEHEFSDNLAPQYATLAHHYRHAENQVQERRYAQLAGEAAAARFANAEAIALLSRALELTAADDLQARWALVSARELVHRKAGRPEARLADLNALAALAEALDDNMRRADVARRRADYAQRRGHYAEMTAAVEQAVAYATASGALKAAMAAHGELGWMLSEQGRYDEARAQTLLALDIARRAQLRQGESAALNTLGNIACAEGEYAAAHDYYTQSVRIDIELGNPGDEIVSLVNFAELAWAQGDYAAARRLCEQGLHQAQALDDRYGEAISLSGLSAIAHACGDNVTAGALSVQTMELAQQIGERDREVFAQTVRGHALTELARYGEAEAVYRQALAIREELEQPTKAMDVLAGLARVALRQDRVADALAWVEHILAHKARHGSLNGADDPLRVALTCFQVLHAAGDGRASAIIDTAYRELHTRAQNIPDATTRRHFLEQVPHHRALAAWHEAQTQAGP